MSQSKGSSISRRLTSWIVGRILGLGMSAGLMRVCDTVPFFARAFSWRGPTARGPHSGTGRARLFLGDLEWARP